MKLTILIVLAYYVHGQSTSGSFGCITAIQECPNENVLFYFYTRNTSNNPLILSLKDKDSIKNANFLQDRPLIILIHGYTGDRNYSPNSHIRPAFFQKGEFNIISIDYANLAKYPCYFSAVKNIQTVSNCTAQLLDFILDTGVFNINSIHVIGFSLGAQVNMIGVLI